MSIISENINDNHAKNTRKHSKQMNIKIYEKLKKEQNIFLENFSLEFRKSIYDAISVASNKGETTVTIKKNDILKAIYYQNCIIHPKWIKRTYYSILLCSVVIGLFILPFAPFAISGFGPKDKKLKSHEDKEFANKVFKLESDVLQSIINDGYKIKNKYNKYIIKW